MDRATFEKIVVKGSYAIVGLDGEWAKVYDVKTGKKIYFHLPTATPFQVRCGCFAIGIACDWDEPVTFERLMELEWAKDISFESEGHAVEFNLKTHRFDFRKWDDGWLCNDKMPTKIMRQVHLLLEVAGVGT